MYAGNPILDEIKIGFKLRPTKTVDKSKPVFIAEGESTDEISPKKRGGPVASSSTDDAPVRSTATTSKWSPKPSSDNSPVAAVTVVPGVVPPPPPPPPCFGGAPPPPPPPPPLGGAPPPPPPPMGSAPPPPPVVRKAITNPALLKLGGKPSGDVDKNELLKSIQGGFKLKKTVTNDKSGLVVDDELKSSSVKMVTPTAPPPSLLAPPKGSGRSQLSPAGSDDERYLTADDRSASCTPEPEEKPRQFKWSCPSERKDVKKSDFVFEEKNLLVSADDLKQEIPTGLAASKIAKWLAAENVDGAATLPRPSFRASPSPLRGNSPFKEMNNNNTMDTLKPKAPSKWAVVETGGLRRPGQGNVPLDKSRETTPQPMRERSCSALEKPYGREQTDRAKTASPERRRASHVETPLSIKTDFPSPTSSAASKVSPSSTAASKPSPATSRSSALSPAASKPSPASSTASKPSPASAASKLASPLSIQTDFSSIAPAKKSSAKKTTTATKKKTSTAKQPEIKETPPTPSAKTNGTSYSYKRTERPASPPEPAVSMPSPVSSMSTASVPSPSSISPGSSSPDTGPRRRAVNANFDKVKEKFANSATVTPSPPPSRPFLKTGGTSVRDSPFHSKTNTPSPRGSVSSTKDEAAAVKKAVKEAAAGKQKQRVINVPINAPWHTPRESYSTGDYSPRDFSRNYGSLDYSSRNYSRDYSSPDFSPRDYTRSYDYSPRSETNWRSSRDPTTPTRTRYDVDSYKFSSMHPDDLRRNYRFNIDVSSDAPLSLSRR